MPFSVAMLPVPTLLGRDVLHRWRMEYDFAASRLEFEVGSADLVAPLSVPFTLPTLIHP